MQEHRSLIGMKQVFFCILFLLFSSPLFAVEIQGTVTEVEGKQVYIQVDANAGINIGDKVVIGSELPGMGMVLIDAQWKVVKTNRGSVTAETSKMPPSAPRPGYLATITTSKQKNIQQDTSRNQDGGSSISKDKHVNLSQPNKISGEIIDIFRDGITTIHLEGHTFAVGDTVDLDYIAGVLPMMIGQYEITTVKGNMILGKPITQNMPPSKGMTVEVTLVKEASVSLGVNEPDNAIETEGSIPHDSNSKLFRQYRAKGLSARKQKNYGEALEYFQKAEKLRPEDTELIGAIAYMFHIEEEFNESITYCEKLIQLNEYEYKAYGILGINYKKLNDPSKAIESFKKVIELKNNDHGAMVNLAGIYFKLKQYKKCEKYMLLYEETINKENSSLVPEKRRKLTRKTLDRFSHYKSVIKKNRI